MEFIFQTAYNTVAYNSLIICLCKEGKMETALGLLDDMRKVGLTPNSVIFNSLMSGYKKGNNMEAAFELHSRMHGEGIPSDTATYTTLIDGALKVGNLAFASELYYEMLENGNVSDVVTYAVLTHSLCEKGNLENANNVLEDMEKMKKQPNVLIYNMLIAGNLREGNVQEAFKLYDEMLDKEYAYTLRVNENSDIYSFGVVILELITGKLPVDPEFGERDLVKWVCNVLEQKGIDQVFDPKVDISYKEEMHKVLNIGLLCVSALPINRPSMRRVVKMLEDVRPEEKLKMGSFLHTTVKIVVQRKGVLLSDLYSKGLLQVTLWEEHVGE